MKTLRKNLTRLILLSVLSLPVVAMAGVQGAGFDSMPTGPYTGGATVTGDPGRVTVEPVANLGGSVPPGATGNVLVIDNRGGNGLVTVTFTYNCNGPTYEDICEIEYDFFYESWYGGCYIGVYVDDDGSLLDADDWFQMPVGSPPSDSWGDNTERESDCVGTHTITFVVSPDAVAYLDNFTTECLDTVPNTTTEWGALKSMYR